MPVDTYMPALNLVVCVGERPADLLRPPARHGDGHPPAGTEHAQRRRHRGAVVGNVLEDLGGDHYIEGAVREWKLVGIRPYRQGMSGLGHLAGLAHRLEHGRYALQVREVEVERGDVCAAAVALEGVPAGAGADVEDALP